MASKFLCRCGEIVRTNLFEGHGLHLLVAEDLIDTAEGKTAAEFESFVNTVIRQSSVVTECHSCGCVAFVDNDYNVRLFEPVTDA